jgi:uncharacterized protein YjbI with pentapeptide repeats
VSGWRDWILERYAAGERDFRRGEFDEATLDLRGVDLAGADFSHCFLVADFREAHLEGCRFFQANVKTCDFRGANLRGASFREAAICGALFDEAGAATADFEGAGWYGFTLASGDKPPVAEP